jgi:hypothetical protein
LAEPCTTRTPSGLTVRSSAFGASSGPAEHVGDLVEREIEDVVEQPRLLDRVLGVVSGPEQTERDRPQVRALALKRGHQIGCFAHTRFAHAPEVKTRADPAT